MQTPFRSPMLAKDFDESKLSFPLVASPKLDGIRAVVSSHEGLEYPLLYSRSGKAIKNKFIQSQLCVAPFHLTGLDGELVVGPYNAPDVYAKTSSGVMAEKGEPDFTYYVFDCHGNVDDGGYVSRCFELEDRINAFNEARAGDRLGRVKILEQKLILNPQELEDFEAEMLAAGFEGVMIRNPAAPYKFGRSTVKDGALLKVKRFAHDEAEVVGVEEMMHNDNEAFTDELGRTKRSTSKENLRPSGMLGAFICRSPKWECTFNVSAGSLSHVDRRLIWEQSQINTKTPWPTLLRFKHLPHGAKDRPRHPLFAGFRDPDDMSSVE